MNTIAIDTESTYTKDVRDISCLGVTGYVNHPDTEHYMISLWCPEWSFVGRWEDAPLDRITEDTTLLAHNRSYDAAVLRRMAPALRPGKWICTADQAAMSQVPRPLAGAAKVVLGHAADKKVRDEMNGKTVASMTPEFMERAKAYALEDARICYELHQKLDPFTETEQTVSEHTTWMGLRGIRVDVPRLEAALTSLTKQVFDLQKTIPWHGELDAKGKEVKTGSPKALAQECAKAGIPAPASTAKNSAEFDQWATLYAEKAPFVKALSDLRSCNRLLTVVQAMETRRRGDILPFGLKYCGAQHTRRWSGDDGLNLQNLPRKAMFGVDVRSFLIPREGHVFVSADYSQIEARVLPWIAGDKELLKLLAAGMDIYEAHARATMGYTDPRPLKEVNPEMRQLSKIRCLAEGTLVLTKSGYVPIETLVGKGCVTVWDGVEWVESDGAVQTDVTTNLEEFRYEKYTPQHGIFENENDFRAVSEIKRMGGEAKAWRPLPHSEWRDVWKLACAVGRATVATWIADVLRTVRVLRDRSVGELPERDPGKVDAVQPVRPEAGEKNTIL